MNTSQDLMELTYKVRGADGKEYGPVTLDEITTWLREGRLSAEGEVMRSDMNDWAPAASFSELQGMLSPAGQPMAAGGAAAATAPMTSDPATAAQLKSGASWFYWVAGLSLINSAVALSGTGWGFIVGLGITQIFDAIGQQFGTAGKAVVLVLDLIVAGVFVLFGVLSHKRHTWAFVLGMVLYALDGLIFLIAQDWLGLGFHAFVLFCLFRGVKACRELNAS